MINLLPNWIFPDSSPAFHDTESVTAIESVGKLHAKMNELITDYNKFVEEWNKKLSEFEYSTKEELEIFESAMRQEFQDFIDVINVKYNILINDLENKSDKIIDLETKTDADGINFIRFIFWKADDYDSDIHSDNVEKVKASEWFPISIASSGGSSSEYGYVEVASPYFNDYEKDGVIITDEAMKELHRKALWYRVKIKTRKEEYGSSDDSEEGTREYETEGLFFPRKNLSTLGSYGGVEGLFLPFYFKHGLYGYTLQGINLIPETLKGFMSWDGEGDNGVGYIIFDITGWFHQFTDDDIESGYEGTRTHYELINCGGDTGVGYACCGDLWVEAYVPIENTSSNYSLRRDYTEYELEMKAKIEARIAARKAKNSQN